MMNYEKIYEDFYSKSFDRMELIIKNFFIKRRSRKRFFVDSINEVSRYFSNDFKSKYNLHNNNDLKNINLIFHNRFSAYTSDATAEILENEIKSEYDKIKTAELPAGYNYVKFIKEMALIEAAKEISRLLMVNSRLLSMFFELNKFDEFEIREQGNLCLDDYPIFKKMHRELYPDYYLNRTENEKFITSEKFVIDKNTLNYNPNHWNVKTFELFIYLVENYEKKGNIKFVNIYYFLKKINLEGYAFTFIHDTYKSFIKENYDIKLTKMEVAQYDYKLKELPILKSWEELFRHSFK